MTVKTKARVTRVDDHGLHAFRVRAGTWSLWIHDTKLIELVDASGNHLYIKTLADLRALKALAPFLGALGPLALAAMKRPYNFKKLSAKERWAIDKKLGILDWDGDILK